jgi:hypothetical protein
MPTTSSKKKADSTKKRPRKDLEEQDADDADSKETKRRNTSKTPVKNTLRPKGAKDSPSISVASDTVRVATNPKVDSSRLQNIEEQSETLEPPPANALELMPTGTTTPSPGSPGKIEVNTQSANGDQIQLVEVEETATPEREYFKWAKLVFLLALLLALVTGISVYTHLSSQLVIGELRQHAQNCKALQSQDKIQDEYYIQELQTQVRVWKQEAKAKDVELEALRLECQSP